MAVTKILTVRGWIGRVALYIENPKKTKNPLVVGSPKMTQQQYNSMLDVIEYASEGTEMNEYATQDYFVSGVNCSAARAREEMVTIKKAFNKDDGICGYHCIQSFKPGEITPELAHKIGVTLANRMWGERYQVVVATHVDREHIHNHFLINSVSFVDGGRMWKEKNCWAIRYQSDRLCREYGLSVIEEPKEPGRRYAEWQAEKDGKPTWRSQLRGDINRLLQQSASLDELYAHLRANGYMVDTSRKYVAVRPPGAERNIRLKSLGDAFTEEALKERIEKQTVRRKQKSSRTYIPVRRSIGAISKPRPRLKGIQALYYKWLYYLGVLPARRKGLPPRNSTANLERRKLKDYIAQFEYINKNSIRSVQDVAARKEKLFFGISLLIQERDRLHRELKRLPEGSPEIADLQKKIDDLSSELKVLRAENRLCDHILARQAEIAKRMAQAEKLPENDSTLTVAQHRSRIQSNSQRIQ